MVRKSWRRSVTDIKSFLPPAIGNIPLNPLNNILGSGLSLAYTNITNMATYSATYNLQNQQFTLFNFLPIKADQVSVNYNNANQTLVMTGKVEIDPLPGVELTAVLNGGNYISISPTAQNMVGAFTLSAWNNVVGLGFGFQNVKLQIDTVQGTVEGSGDFVWGTIFGNPFDSNNNPSKIHADLKFITHSGSVPQLDNATLDATGLTIPLPILPSAFIDALGASITNIVASANMPTTFGGHVGIGFGPNASTQLAQFDLGSTSDPMTFSSNGFHGDGSLKFTKGIDALTASVTVDVSFINKTVAVDANVNILQGFIQGQLDFTADANFDFGAVGQLAVQFPQTISVDLFGNQTDVPVPFVGGKGLTASVGIDLPSFFGPRLT